MVADFVPKENGKSKGSERERLSESDREREEREKDAKKLMTQGKKSGMENYEER